jgi:Tol biopolymer transport system component
VGQSGADAKLPAERAGQIGVPLGKIAFIREGDLWVMDWDGKNQYKVVSAQNADGRLSWAPDNRRIAFCRKGNVNLQGPDNLGGQHRVYDIFIGYLDSAKSNTNWWRRLTEDLGSRHPEWSADGSKIIFTKDMNANFINALLPDYQICSIDTTGGSFKMISEPFRTKDRWASMATMGPNGYMAFVLFKDKNAAGVVIAPPDLTGLSDAALAEKAKIINGATAPAWSPDGNWIAYINSEVSNQGIYIVKPDLSEKFLVHKPGPGLSYQTYPLSWSPDSKWLTFATQDGAIWIIDITGNGLKQILLPGLNVAPAWSKKK